MKDLKELRTEIDIVDKELIELLEGKKSKKSNNNNFGKSFKNDSNIICVKGSNYSPKIQRQNEPFY